MSGSGVVAPHRRRLYLMRHASVAYFPEHGAPADASSVELSDAGCAQADAVGRFFAEHRVRFDRVVTSGLPRTRQTAERVLAQCAPVARPVVSHWPELRELESGSLEAALDPERDAEQLRGAFVAPFEGEPARDVRFRGGESVGELIERVVPAIERLVRDTSWSVALLVLHGAVNRVVLSYALNGARTLLANFQQAPACINAIDVASDHVHWLIRYVNHAPYDAAQADVRDSTMETLLSTYLHYRRR